MGRNFEAYIKAYSRILVDPVRLYVPSEHSMNNVSAADRKTLLNYADAA